MNVSQGGDCYDLVPQFIEESVWIEVELTEFKPRRARECTSWRCQSSRLVALLVDYRTY